MNSVSKKKRKKGFQTAKNRIFFAIESKEKILCLRKFSKYLFIVKDIKMTHWIGLISHKNSRYENNFLAKENAKLVPSFYHSTVSFLLFLACSVSSFCCVIFIFSCIFSLLLWNTFFLDGRYQNNMLQGTPPYARFSGSYLLGWVVYSKTEVPVWNPWRICAQCSSQNQDQRKSIYKSQCPSKWKSGKW